ncbi:MAG: hypothetical protein DMD87_08180 [Candidatus Rokuibacteriota bacterium]|nr:MAG: hypothetical protein DMD87_08180 [Candidatus Rokubacteria bacterium]
MMEVEMATIAAREHAEPQALSAASWRALVALFLGWLFDGYETYALILVAAVALRQLLPPDQLASLPIYIGGLLAVTLVGWATGGIIAGVLADYIGRKRVLMLSILWYALFTGLTAFATSYASFVVLRFLTGLGLGAEWGPGTAILGESWPSRSRGRAASVLQSAFAFGLVLASVVWLYVAPLGPSAWRYMFLIGVLPAFSLLWIRTSVRDPELWVRQADSVGAHSQTASPPAAGAVDLHDRRVVGRLDLGPVLCRAARGQGRRRHPALGRAGRALLQPGRHPRVLGLRHSRRRLGAEAHDAALLRGRGRPRPGAVPSGAGSFHVSPDRRGERILHGRPVRVDARVPAGAVSDGRARLGDLAGLRCQPFAAASIIGLSYLVGLVVTPFAAPETKGRPLPA